jgi:hypothetical protein
LNNRMSRRSFLGVAAAGLATTVLDWNKINAVAEKMGARQDYPTVYFKASDKHTEVITRQGESRIRKPIFISPERFAAEAGPYFIWRLSSWPPRR